MQRGLGLLSSWSGSKAFEEIMCQIEVACTRAGMDPGVGCIPLSSCDSSTDCIQVAQKWRGLVGKQRGCHFPDISDRLSASGRKVIDEYKLLLEPLSVSERRMTDMTAVNLRRQDTCGLSKSM